MARHGARWRARAALGAVLLLLVMSSCGSRGDSIQPVGAAWGDAADIPEKLAADGATVVVGDPDASVTLRIYEEPRCPHCRDFELSGAGPDIREMLLNREIRVEFVLASFLDRDGTGGSKRAVNALRAALEQDRFLELHQKIYASQSVFPRITDAGLLRMAGTVEGLRGEAFDSAVREMRYAEFVAASQAAYESDGADGTPSMQVQGEWIPDISYRALYEDDFKDWLYGYVGRHAG